MKLLPLLFCSLGLVAAIGCQTEPAPQITPSQLREQAAAAENRGRYRDAADVYLRLVKTDPERAEWYVEAGRCLGRSGRFKEALELLDGARKKFPGLPDVAAMLARTMLLEAESGQALQPEILWTDAAAIAEEVLAVDANHLDSRLLLAQARFLLGEWDAADACAEEAVKRHPNHPGAYILIGRIATERFAQLSAAYAKLADADDAAKAEIVAAIDAQRTRAGDALRKAVAADPSRAHPHIALAQLAVMDRKDDAARAHFGDALVADPLQPVDHSALCRGLTAEQRASFYAGLLQRYEARGDAVAKKAAALRWQLGRAYYDGERWADAEAAFGAALAADPSATNSHYYLCLCAYRRGDHDRAEQHAAAYAAAGAPEFADVLRSLDVEPRGQMRALLQFLADRAFAAGRKEPSRDINHVIACLVDSADAWNNHAFLCRETGQFEAAWSSYGHALEKEPESPQLWNDAAVILQYHLRGDENLAKAKQMYGRAIELAGKVAANPKASAIERDRAAQAAKDAKANLAELGG
ncbi:MAG: hypothetical protein RL398_3044 [Planctomycetota bacterium]